jgi:hypothetical protein
MFLRLLGVAGFAAAIDFSYLAIGGFVAIADYFIARLALQSLPHRLPSSKSAST